jgi:L-arabinose isomerase
MSGIFEKDLEIWFVTGSQHLYGPEALREVEANSRKIAKALGESKSIIAKVVFKSVLTTPDGIEKLCLEADASPKCIGIVAWMHTFSPAKMWIAGLSVLKKPLLHLHTQFNRDIPWTTMDMDFMNLNQSAHGDREFGFINSRMRIERKVVVGHWQDPEVAERIGVWVRAAAAWNEMRHLKLVRFGDNMRNVAVTEGDKVEAQIRFGMSVNTHGISELVEAVNQVSDAEIDRLCKEYDAAYKMQKELKKGGEMRDSLRTAAKIEIGLRNFLEAGGYHAFTDNFEDLPGMTQLPGIAAQRLMADGYGFGAEGDWKQAALVRAEKVMAQGIDKGTSFMEDYTYHLDPKNMTILGAHMLEVCPSLAKGKPSCEIHPLGIGGKADPVRLVFGSVTGPALASSIVDMGNRFRIVANAVTAVEPLKDLPKLPVSRVLWKPEPDLKTGAAAWIYAGGGHHTSFSFTVTPEYLDDFASMAGVELVLIDKNTDLRSLKNELRWSEAYYGLKGML